MRCVCHSLSLLLLTLVLAPSTATGQADSAPATAEQRSAAKAKPDPARISLEEIEAARLPNAYELVERLRRPWLRGDAMTGQPVVVYLDDQPLGAAERLRDLTSVEVGELVFYPNEAAVRRWGSIVKGSVIAARRRR